MGIQQNIQSEDTLGSAVRYKDPKKPWYRNSSGRKLYIEQKALDYLNNLNTYDQAQICRGIERLASVPSPQDGLVQEARPAHFKAKFITVTCFNYSVKYQLNSELVVVQNITLNDLILGKQDNPKDERSCLYNVKQGEKGGFSESSSLSEIRNLHRKWTVSKRSAVTEVITPHAAVNGMLNNLEKATWLMGAHLQHAYPKDDFSEYSLFHNPSQSAKLDFFESARDNLGLTTDNAKRLAAILADVQRKGKSVKWVVHSQGGIIFKQAVAYHIKNNPGQMLNKNTVVFHAGGNNKKTTDQLLSKVGIKKAAPDKDNPFDPVPSLAGGNDLSLSAFKRGLAFWAKVKGSGDPNPVESPHTLPYISLEAYYRFLVLAGDSKSAERVSKYMDKINGSI